MQLLYKVKKLYKLIFYCVKFTYMEVFCSDEK